jgi:hypothetical protein
MSGTAWSSIIVDDLFPYLVSAQIGALRTAALSTVSPNQGDPFIPIMPAMASRIRAAIATCPANQISLTTNSVPPSAKWVLIWLTLEEMQTRIPGLNFTKAQIQIIADAKKWLVDVAACKLGIEQPIDPDPNFPVLSGPNAFLINPATRYATPTTLAGL